MSLEAERAIAEIVRSFLGMKDTVRVSYDELLPLARRGLRSRRIPGGKRYPPDGLLI